MTVLLETMADVRHYISEWRDPQFILPARFREASFDSFQIDPAYPDQRRLRDRVRCVAGDAKASGRRGWRRKPENQTSLGLFLVGPPGVGKTHLLAAGYRSVVAPKLFATFDELVAAAGPLGMQRLTELVTAPSFVCIDEVVLEDPGNIMMLATLLGHLVDSRTRIVATANMPPTDAGGQNGWLQVFERELGQIASAFDLEHIDGRDRRMDTGLSRTHPESRAGSILRVTWSQIDEYLATTHPMHDAAWLEQVRTLEIQTAIRPPADRDRALRFVRFIDRVYDRDVQLALPLQGAAPRDLVQPLTGDPRYVWHVARGESRLSALLNCRHQDGNLEQRS